MPNSIILAFACDEVEDDINAEAAGASEELLVNPVLNSGAADDEAAASIFNFF